MNVYIDEPPFLIENNKQTNVSFRIKESKCVCADIQIISENIWTGKKPLLTPVSFHKGAENTQLPVLTGRQCPMTVQCFSFHS